MTRRQFVAVAGSALCLPIASDLAQLHARLSKGDALSGTVRRFGLPHTDILPAHVRIAGCPEPAPTGATRRLPHESRLAVAVAAQALHGRLPRSTQCRVGTVWASSTAGMDEYGQICVEAATLPPGLASPSAGPHAAYNAAAVAVSVRLGLTGPQLAVTGGCDAGASAVVEAMRMLHEEQCGYVAVGGSAAVSGWRLVGRAERPADQRPAEQRPCRHRASAPEQPDPLPADGALCLLLAPGTGSGPNPAVRLLRRSRLPLSTMERTVGGFVSECVASTRSRPVVVALSGPPAAHAAAQHTLARHGTPCWHVDRLGGELGAAGGLLAVTAAVAAVSSQHPNPVSALALAIGGSGYAVAVEVVSTKE